MLIAHLQPLHHFQGGQQLEHWNELIRAGDFPALVAELLTRHYDPSYFRATSRHYVNLDKAQRVPLVNLSQPALKEILNSL